jgi:DNA-binding LacI/PurR family transcriptional regulator
MSCVGDLDSQISLPDGVSQREIADEIGVSVSTVSRALSGNERVSRRTLDDVRRAIETLQGKHSGPAPTLLGQQVIGLTTSHVSDEFRITSLDTISGHILGGAELAAQRHGHRMYTARDSKLLLDEANRHLLHTMSGLILAGGIVSEEVLNSARASGVPVCIVGGHVANSGVPSVGSDFHHGMALATQHLIDLGHTRIALVNGPHETYTSHEKLAGYLGTLMEANLPISPDLVKWFPWFSAFDNAVGLQTMTELFALDRPPTAIAFATDDLAVGGVTLLQRRGLQVPDDISIVGFHDDPMATATTPRLTTIRVDRAGWGERAVERLIAIEHGKAMQAERLLLPVELIVRDSTGPAPSPRRVRSSWPPVGKGKTS